VAVSIISFPLSGNARSVEARPAQKASSRLRPAASTTALPFASLRHRGLHIINRASASFPAASSPRRDSQAQADRIVAQVEQEIANRAFREAQQRLHGHTNRPSTQATVHTMPVTEIETPASVARRLFAALLSFARTA
jgi:hypothetical protein